MKLHCDYCTTVEDADDCTPDWNGETGCHLSCEAAQRPAPRIDRDCDCHATADEHDDAGERQDAAVAY